MGIIFPPAGEIVPAVLNGPDKGRTSVLSWYTEAGAIRTGTSFIAFPIEAANEELIALKNNSIKRSGDQ